MPCCAPAARRIDDMTHLLVYLRDPSDYAHA